MKKTIKSLKEELKKTIYEARTICSAEGILIGSLYITLFIITVILSIPFLPIYLINESSKSWFKKDDEE